MSKIITIKQLRHIITYQERGINVIVPDDFDPNGDDDGALERLYWEVDRICDKQGKRWKSTGKQVEPEHLSAPPVKRPRIVGATLVRETIDFEGDDDYTENQYNLRPVTYEDMESLK